MDGPDAVAPPAGESPLSEQEMTIQILKDELRAMKEKTAGWKKSVKAQLEEAAQKNTTLRADLRQTQADAATKQAELRVELEKEFRGRTLEKDKTISDLEQTVKSMKEARTALLQTHQEEMSSAQEQAKKQLSLEVRKAMDEQKTLYGPKISALEEVVSKLDAAQEELKQENAVLSAKLSQMKSTVADYESQISELNEGLQDSPGDEELADSGRPSGVDGESSPRSLREKSTDDDEERLPLVQQTPSCKRRLPKTGSMTVSSPTTSVGAIAALKAKMEELSTDMTARYEAEKVDMKKHHKEELEKVHQRVAMQLQDEVQSREHQIQVLHSLLRHAQADAQYYQDKSNSAQTILENSEEQLTKKIYALAKELSDGNTQLTNSQERVKELERELDDKIRHIADIQEEGEIRERAFNELMMNDDGKTMLATLEEELRVAKEDSMNVREMLKLSRDEIAAKEEKIVAVETSFKSREESLSNTARQVNTKIERLHLQEQRTREQHQQLVAQANAMLMQVGASTSKPGKSVSGTTRIPIGHPNDGLGGENGEMQETEAAASFATVASALATLQMQYRRAAGGSQTLFRTYKRFVPVAIIVLFLISLMYWWVFSGTSTANTGDGNLRKYTDMREELELTKRQLLQVKTKLQTCCVHSTGASEAQK